MKLYLLVNDGGDGSYHISYSLSRAKIEELQAKYDNGDADCGDVGVDGDGFHYSTIEVPDGSTAASLGLSDWQLLENEE